MDKRFQQQFCLRPALFSLAVGQLDRSGTHGADAGGRADPGVRPARCRSRAAAGVRRSDRDPPREHARTVTVAGQAYFANCIWDAFGVAAALGRDVDIVSACGDCDAEMRFAVRGLRKQL